MKVGVVIPCFYAVRHAPSGRERAGLNAPEVLDPYLRDAVRPRATTFGKTTQLQKGMS